MVKKTVRIGILLVLVASFMFSQVSATPALAVAVEESEWWTGYEIYDAEWEETGWMEFWDKYGDDLVAYDSITHSRDMTVGDLKSKLKAEFGFPMIAVAWKYFGDCFEEEFDPENFKPFVLSDGDRLADHPVCPYYEGITDTYITFFRAPQGQAATRLTLFGYVNDDNKSCVLWSLDGSRPVNVDSKCGGGSELVCTVKLVEKKLKYDCEGNYDWLGEQIVNDSKWLAWADKFASMNGNK